MKQKLAAFKYPKGFSCRPILIHANSISDELVESDYFADIIDFCELLEDANSADDQAKNSDLLDV